MAVSFQDNKQGMCTSGFETDETMDESNASEGGVDSESDTAGVALAVHPIHSSGVASGTSALVQIPLASGEAARVVSEILDMDPVSYDDDVEKFEEAAAAALDRSISRVVDLLRQNRTAAAIWIQGFDFGPLFPTAETRCSHRTHIPAAVAAGLARLLGLGLVGYSAEKIYTHPLFHDIRPVQGGKEGSNGSGEPLNFHMDMSYEFTNAPEWLVLLCLREGVDPDVKTPFISNRALYTRLEDNYPEDLAILKDPTSYKIERPPSAGGGFSEEMPLLTGDHADDATFWLRVHHNRIVPQGERAKTALSHMQSLMGEIADDSVHLVAGDVFLINNWKSLHTRTKFKAAFNEEDRLLQRSYFKERSDLPEGRIF